jgi:hypothetical protein
MRGDHFERKTNAKAKSNRAAAMVAIVLSHEHNYVEGGVIR